MKTGAQFFTIRDFCQTLDDFSESLKKVADIGYKYVQISGTCAYEPEWLKKELDKNGLECVITHTPFDKMAADAKKVAKDHDVFNCKYVGLGFYDFTKEDSQVEKFVTEMKPIAKALKENGKYLMYHNHNNEFKKFDGKTVMESLAENFLPDEMGFTLDTYWVQTAGGDPAYWLEYLKGRVPCIHLKDHDAKRQMAVLGEGNINFDRVFIKAQEAGCEYMLVEQDDCYGKNPFDCLKKSYEYLKSRGF